MVKRSLLRCALVSLSRYMAELRNDQSLGAAGLVRLVLLGIGLACAAIAVAVVGLDEVSRRLREAADSNWGIAAFVLAYVLAVVLLVPGTVGAVASGVVFGFRLGFPIALLSATLGATGAFLVARWLGRPGVQRLLGPKLRSIDRWVEGNDFVAILVLRLMPIVPFNGLNYAAGLAPIRLGRYVPASLIGMIPGTALVTFAAAESDDPTSPRFLAAMTAVALATIASIVYSRRLRSADA